MLFLYLVDFKILSIKNKKIKKTLDFIGFICYYNTRGLENRDVAQFGRALRSGRRGRRFKSCHPDHYGVWLSLVEYLNGVQGAAGSNPVTPTIGSLNGLAKPFFCFPEVFYTL